MIYTNAETNLSSVPSQPFELCDDAHHDGRTSQPGMIFYDTRDNLRLLELASGKALNEGNTVEDPRRLLCLAQSAASRDDRGQFNADLHFALKEIKKVMSPSGSGTKGDHLCTLSEEDRHEWIWAVFELCSAHLARDGVLEGHLSIALDAIPILYEVLFQLEASRSTYQPRSKELTERMDMIWHKSWTSRAALATSKPMRSHLGDLLHGWVHVCQTFDCLPVWGASYGFWLAMFLWTKQLDLGIESLLKLIDCMQVLDSVGPDTSSTLTGEDLRSRLATVVRQAAGTFGEDTLLSRFKGSMGNLSFPSGDLSRVMMHVSRYSIHPPLNTKLIESGTVHAFLEAGRRLQRDGLWDLFHARYCCEFLALVVRGTSSLERSQTVSLFVTEEHLMRDFVIPAIWLGLREHLSSCNHANNYLLEARAEIDLIRWTADATEVSISLTKGSRGHALMDTLRAEVAPRWHLTNRAMRSILITSASFFSPHLALTSITSNWRRLGESLGLDIRRTQRQIEGPEPVVPAFCSWPLCLYHNQKPPTALKSCAGCGQVRYCSKQCQTSDWKLDDHKLRCRRMKK